MSVLTNTAYTGATNAWQKILKPSGFESYDVTEIRVRLHNQSSDKDIKLFIYDGETDASSNNPNTRFAGQTAIASSASVTVSTDTPTMYSFDLSSVSLTGTTYSYWIKGSDGGSVGGVKAWNGDGGTDGAAGGWWGTHHHEVLGVP